jgi:hypothetical protein
MIGAIAPTLSWSPSTPPPRRLSKYAGLAILKGHEQMTRSLIQIITLHGRRRRPTRSQCNIDRRRVGDDPLCIWLRFMTAPSPLTAPSLRHRCGVFVLFNALSTRCDSVTPLESIPQAASSQRMTTARCTQWLASMRRTSSDHVASPRPSFHSRSKSPLTRWSKLMAAWRFASGRRSGAVSCCISTGVAVMVTPSLVLVTV